MGNASFHGFEFRGAEVVRAVFRDLVKRRGLGQRGSDVVVFGGGSAGSRGAMVHLEYVRDWVRPNPKHSFSVIGHLDSPLWVDVDPFSNASSDA